MSAVQLKRWPRQEYDRLIDTGILGPEDRVELLDGEIVVTFPKNPPHSVAVQLTAEALRAVFSSGFVVRSQEPFGAGDDSEPEPDVAVVPGRPRDYARAHPTTAVLLVEVSDSSLELDRQRKGSLYARAGVPEHWIANLIDRTVEVYRGPHPDGTWEVRAVYREGRSLSPLSAPNASIAVVDLLPLRLEVAVHGVVGADSGSWNLRRIVADLASGEPGFGPADAPDAG